MDCRWLPKERWDEGLEFDSIIVAAPTEQAACAIPPLRRIIMNLYLLERTDDIGYDFLPHLANKAMIQSRMTPNV
ncbi:hypothetical protein SPFM12_00001 [Salmonella phage SPFM12]|nr:hypothetical protein SPFM12_00001 [Salmonella phage SPFM12]